MRPFLFILCLLFLSANVHGQGFTISGKASNTQTNKVIVDATVCLNPSDNCTSTDEKGNYKIKHVKPGTYTLIIINAGYEHVAQEITVADRDVTVNIPWDIHSKVLDTVSIKAYKSLGTTYMKDVDGTGIYAGKKSEVIVLKNITANTATNNARQIYSSVAGLNIWENDGGAGIQLAIGGRGLDPNRVSNFNTRQNGYDISADALGYPESYYTPPAESVERIEIVRGAASLQYGTQFGGIINFKMNDGPDDQKYQIISRETAGSWGFFNTSNSIGGTIKKWKYYAFYQHKAGNGWRPNSQFNSNMAYLSATYKANRKLSITAQYTHLDYLEHQPGGLSDAEFAADPHQSIKARNWFKVNWNLAAVLVDYKISDNATFNSRFFGLLANRDALGIINTVNDPDKATDARQYRTDAYTNWGNESRLLYKYNLNNSNPFTLLGGIRYYSGYTDRQVGNGNNGAGGTKADFAFSKSTVVDSLSYSRYKFPNHNAAVFAENIFKVGPKFSIIPGARFENIITEADGSYNIFQPDQSNNVKSSKLTTENRVSRRSFLIGGIGFSYDKSSACQIYANISQNYKSINFNDMSIVNTSVRVDSNLKDEKGYSADLGVRGHFTNIVSYDISLFTINYADRIGTVQSHDPSTLQVFQYITNIAQSRNYGLESYVEIDLWKLVRGDKAKFKLIGFSNFSWIDARYVNSKEPAYENKQVEFVPAVILKTGVSLRKNKFSATWQYSYTAQQFTEATDAVTPSDGGINGLVPAYFVMDLSADYKINKMFSVSASVNNLTNNMYFTRRADSYPGPGIIPADARSYYVTFQVKI